MDPQDLTPLFFQDVISSYEPEVLVTSVQVSVPNFYTYVLFRKRSALEMFPLKMSIAIARLKPNTKLIYKKPKKN